MTNLKGVPASLPPTIMTRSGVVAPCETLELRSATAIAATIPHSREYQGLFTVKCASPAPGAGVTHTVTLTDGTWNGADDVATFNAAGDLIVIHFDSNGHGVVVHNAGAVVFS